MIVSRTRTIHPHSSPLTIGRTELNESDDLVILGVTFDFMITFEKHLRSVSRAAAQRLGILRKSWQVSMIFRFFGNAFGGLFCQFWSTVLQCGARLPKYILHYWMCSQWCQFSNCMGEYLSVSLLIIVIAHYRVIAVYAV